MSFISFFEKECVLGIIINSQGMGFTDLPFTIFACFKSVLMSASSSMFRLTLKAFKGISIISWIFNEETIWKVGNYSCLAIASGLYANYAILLDLMMLRMVNMQVLARYSHNVLILHALYAE